jgi:hypothetical protein
MSDINTSLPIRTENNADAVIAIADKTVTSRTLTVNADGSINVIATATALDIRALTFATDKVDVSGSTVELGATTLAALESITVQNGSGGAAVNIQDGGNSITVDGTVELGATTLAALESITVQNGSGGAAVNIQDGGNSITVDAVALDIRPLTFATDKVDVSGSTVSIASTGTAVADYSTASAVAGGATSNHSYTVTTATTLHLQKVSASSSGKMKIEIQTETGVGTNTYTTKAVKFGNTADQNMDFEFPTPLLVAAGVRVRVIRTNKEGSSQDLYSTIMGYEV